MEKIIEKLTIELGIKRSQVENTIKLSVKFMWKYNTFWH